MARASKIGAHLYKGLPVPWRKFWMYQSFTGEVMTMLKEGKTEKEIKPLLWRLYVKDKAQGKAN
jgi:hypothetical protein